MGLFSYLRGVDLDSKALTGTSTVLEAISARQFSPYPALGGTNLAKDRINSVYVTTQNASYGWIYRYSPSVRRVVDYIARNVAQLGLKVYERVSDDEREHAGDHPAAKALRNPNPQTPGQQFIFNLVADFCVYNNAYALKFMGPDGLTLVGLPPHLVGLVGRSHFEVEAYRIWRLDGTYFDVAPENVVHWRGYNPDDPRKGESYLETLREELAADSASRQATTELHRSGLALPGWIERPVEAPPWSEEARKRFEEDWANRAKAGKRKSPVLEEGMSYKQGGVTPEDAEMIAGRVWNQDLVSSLYGMKHVPPEGEEERKQFYADVLPPITEILAAFLDLHVLVQEYDADDHYFEFNMDEKLMGDDRLKALTSAAGAPPLTRNEARARLNLPAKEGGDELITPLNVTVGGKPSPQVMPVQNPNGPPQDGSHREEDAPIPAGRSIARSTDHRLNGHNKTMLVPRRVAQGRRRNNWGGQYGERLSAHFARQERVIKSAKAKASAATVRWNKELATDLLELSRLQFDDEGSHQAFRMNSAFDPGEGENWLAAKAAGAAAAINSVTQAHIEDKGTEDAFAHAKDVRASAASKVYATDVGAFAVKAAWQQTPDAEKREIAIDGGECEVCAPYQGTHLASELDSWPGYHNACNCIADPKSAEPQTKQIDALEYVKALALIQENSFKALAQAITEQKAPQVTIHPAQTNFHENAIKSETLVQAPEVTISEGAMQVDVTNNVDQPNIDIDQPDVNVNIEEGAITNPVTVEPGVTNVSVPLEGAVNAPVNVESPEVTVHEPQQKQPRIIGKKVIRDKDNRIQEVVNIYEEEQPDG